jgi:dTDP-4-amino-4,6-dideoxygalactose transaminase
MVVHFFGIYQSLTSIKGFCQERKLLLVEDCAHILPDPQTPCPAGAMGDIAIFSLRKLLPVSQGGVLLDRAAAEFPGGETAAGRPAPLRFKKRVLMVAETMAFHAGLNLLRVKRILRRFLGNTDSSTLSGERQSGWRPLDLPVNGDGAGYLAAVVARRQQNYGYLAEHLRHLPGVDLPFRQLPEGSCPQGFPLLVPDRERLSAQLHRRGIEAMIWPGEEGVALPREAYPGTQHWQERLLLLPVHQELREVHLDYIVRTLRQELPVRF